MDPNDPRRIADISPDAPAGTYLVDACAAALFELRERKTLLKETSADPHRDSHLAIFRRAVRWWALKAAMGAAIAARDAHVDRPQREAESRLVDGALTRIEIEAARILECDIEKLALAAPRFEADQEDIVSDAAYDSAIEAKEDEYRRVFDALRELQAATTSLRRSGLEIRYLPDRGGDVLRQKFFQDLGDCWRTLMFGEPPTGRSGHFVRLVHAAWVDTNMPPIADGAGRSVQSPDRQIRAIGAQIHEHFKQKH